MPASYTTQPLADLLPVQPRTDLQSPDDGYRLTLTPGGRRHPALMIGETEAETTEIWNVVSENVPLYAVSEYSRPAPAARTLIAARDGEPANAPNDETAFLCWGPFGRGRVVYLSSPDTWRLRFRQGDRLHHRFWGQLLRWAVSPQVSPGTEFVQIRSDRSHYQTQDAVEVRVRLTDANGPLSGATPSVIAERTDGAKSTVSLTPDDVVPGEYAGQFRGLAAGVYKLQPQGATVDVAVWESQAPAPETVITVRSEHQPELLDTRCRLEIARGIAEGSGGLVVPPTAIDEVIELTDLSPIVTETTRSRAIWAQWKYLWIVVLCMSGEWILRKWKGLP